MKFWPVSYGGSGTNWLADVLDRHGLLVDRQWWAHHCHSPVAFEEPGVTPILLFRRPADAFLSQEARGLVDLNLRKMGWHPSPETRVEAFDRCAARLVRSWLSRAALILPYAEIPNLAQDLSAYFLAMTGKDLADDLATFSPAAGRAVADHDALFPVSTALTAGRRGFVF